jgi:glucose-6-phosphate-specific signal transduction histidine kinase
VRIVDVLTRDGENVASDVLHLGDEIGHEIEAARRQVQLLEEDLTGAVVHQAQPPVEDLLEDIHRS